MAVGSFFPLQPDCPKQPRTSFPFYKFFYPTISGRISAKMQLFSYSEHNFDLKYSLKKECNKKVLIVFVLY
jgi:hypothetical protein